MLKIRIIPTLLFSNRTIVKSKNFSNNRMIGDPTTVARVFNTRNADELIFLDILASKLDQEMNFKVISDIAKECFMPLTIGGGIRSLKDVDKIFQLGADKISINTIALLNPKIIKEISEKYGSQAIVVSIDVKKSDNNYKIFSHGGTIKSDYDLISYVKEIEKQGAGEILLNSIDKDGTMEGYDLELIKLVSSNTSLPVIASGGCGSLKDCHQAIISGADAISAASIFHYVGESIITIKKYLSEQNVSVRLV